MIYTAIPLAASALWDLGRECVMYTSLDAKSWFRSVLYQFVHIYGQDNAYAEETHHQLNCVLCSS
jgi:hypothetical protein